MTASLLDRRARTRVGAALTWTFLGAGFGILGLSACGSSDASGGTPAPAVAPAPTDPATTVLVATTAPTTTVAAPTTVAPVSTDAPATTAVGSQITVSDADVADLEKQLDEIDQLLNGVDADLAQD